MRPAPSRLCGLVGVLLLAAPAAGQERRVVAGPLPEGAVGRLGVPRPEGQETAFAGGCTPSGALVVASAFGKEVRVRAWQSPRDPVPADHLAAAGGIVRLALSDDAHFLAAADKLGAVRVWDLQSGKEQFATSEAGEPVTGLALDGRGGRLAVSGKKGTAIWDLATGKATWLRGQSTAVIGVAFGKGGLVATGDARGRVRLWEADGTRRAELPWKPLPNKRPPEPAPVPGFPGRFGRGMPGWTPPEPPGLRFVVEFTAGVSHLRFSPDGKELAAAGGTVVRLWDLPARRVRWEHNRHSHIFYDLWVRNSAPLPPCQIGRVDGLLFTPDGKQVLSWGAASDVRFTDAGDGNEVRAQELEGYRWPLYREPPPPGYGVALPPGKTYLVFRAGRDFQEFDLRTGRRLAAAGAHLGPVFGLAASPDGKRLASFAQGKVYLWDLPARSFRAEAPCSQGADRGPAYSPDGRFLKSGTSYRQEFTVWRLGPGATDLAPWKKDPTLKADAAGFLPNEPATLLMVEHQAGLGTVRLADGAARSFGQAPADHPHTLAVAPDGKSVVVGRLYHKPPLLLDAATGKELRPLEGGTDSDVVAFSPDGRLVAAAGCHQGRPSPVLVWDAETGRRRYELSGHKQQVLDLAFSPDGRMLAAADLDGNIRLWEAASGKLRRTFRTGAERVPAIAWVPGGSLLASAGWDGAVYLWDVRK